MNKGYKILGFHYSACQQSYVCMHFSIKQSRRKRVRKEWRWRWRRNWI